MRLVGLLTSMALWMTCASGWAVDFFPLDTGIVRTYEHTYWNPQLGWENSHFTTQIVGEDYIGGKWTYVMEFAGYPNDELRQYWSGNQEGDRFLHGADRTDVPYHPRYSPPLLYVDAPLTVGKTWDHTVAVTGVSWATHLRLRCTVESWGRIMVPYGSYTGATVLAGFQWLKLNGKAANSSYSPSGEQLPGDSSQSLAVIDYWYEGYVDGVGYMGGYWDTTSDLLTTMQDITSVESRTWSQIRQIYR